MEQSEFTLYKPLSAYAKASITESLVQLDSWLPSERSVNVQQAIVAYMRQLTNLIVEDEAWTQYNQKSQ